MGGLRPRVMPKRAPGVRIPVRGAQSDKRRHQTTPPLSGTDRASRSISAERLDHAQAVPQPLDHGAGDKHRTFQAIRDLAAEAPADRGQQTVAARRRLRASVHQQEAAGAIRVLALPGSKQAWPNVPPVDRPRCPAIGIWRAKTILRRRPYTSLEDRPRGNIAAGCPAVQQFVVPIQRVNVENSVRLALL